MSTAVLEANESAAPDAPPAVARAAGRVATVLVVDDTPIDRLLAGRIIGRQAGLRVLYAENGVEALRAIGREAPNAVLTDLQMPEMDGLELVGEVRRLHPLIPVVLMTAHGSEDIAIQALRLGAANYVPKKTLSRDLLETLNRVLAVAGVDRTRQRVLGSLTRRESTFYLENDPTLVTTLISLLQEDHLGMDLWDETTRMRVGIALEEALLNALYHGNLEVSSDLRHGDEKAFYQFAGHRRRTDPYRQRRIYVRASHLRSVATYVIRDEGPGFDVSILDRPIDPESMLLPSGRGLLLIRTFMDIVAFNKAGNEITLVKKCRCDRGA